MCQRAQYYYKPTSHISYKYIVQWWDGEVKMTSLLLYNHIDMWRLLLLVFGNSYHVDIPLAKEEDHLHNTGNRGYWG